MHSNTCSRLLLPYTRLLSRGTSVRANASRSETRRCGSARPHRRGKREKGDDGTMNAACVVAGVDGSEESRQALRWAFEYAQICDAPVEAVIAWEIPPSYGWLPSYDDVDFEKQAQETLEEAIRDVLGENATALLRRVERGHPAKVLVAASEHAQLLVVGSRGHGAFAGMLIGSVSQHLVQHAHCPVLVIRGHGRDARPGR